jgi:hypothetical protein
LSAKHLSPFVVFALAAVAPVVVASSASAQERSDEPGDKLAPTGRTEEPTGPGEKGTRPRPIQLEPSSSESPPEKNNNGGAPWSWPWGGAVRSPSWTQDDNWNFTEFWLMDVGHVSLEAQWTGSVARRTYEIDNFMQGRARIGLLPHIELTITEDVTQPYHEKISQEGNEIGARVAFWDYGTLPLNPAFEIVWHPRHNGPDGYEARGMLGGELFKGFFIVGNAYFMGDTGGSHDYDWGFRGGVAFELIHDVLRVGCEGGVQWHWNKDHDKTPFRDTAPSVGPSLLFRPLALVKPEWGHWLKLTATGEFGIRDDNDKQPFMKGGLLLAVAF